MSNKYVVAPGALVTLAAALAFPVAPALADEVSDLTSPNVAEIGLHLENHGDAVPPRQREYTGLDGGTKGSLDLRIVDRDKDGWWIKAYANQLNLPTQEYGASVELQGRFRIGFDHDEQIHIAPYLLNTKVQGIGTGNLVLNQDFRGSAGQGPLRTLELTRIKNGFSAYVNLLTNLRINLGARAEDKTGEIMSATIGSTRNNALGNGKNYSTMFFAPQPEDYRHRQLDASIDYSGKKLQLSAGLYGSYFENNILALRMTPGYNSLPTVPAAAAPANGNVAIPTGNYGDPWISLPPDSQSVQFFLNGGYSFTGANRLTFRATRSVGTQNDSFIPAYGGLTAATGYYTLNPPGVPYAAGILATSLNGKVVTTSYAATFTSRVTQRLSLKAAVRYQDRDDQTPQRLYLDALASSEFPDGEANDLHNEKDTNAVVEASYRLPGDLKITGGYAHRNLKRPDSPRPDTDEGTYRVELQRPLGELVSGWLIYAYSKRTGGEWELPDPTASTTSAVTFSTATAVAAPLQFVDRNRGKLRVMLDFSPSKVFSGQVYYEHQRDSYPFVPATGNARMGMTHSSQELAGLDLDLQVTRKWHATGYFTYETGDSHQNELYTPRPASGDQNCAVSPTRAFTANCSPWEADLGLRGRVFGVGLNGKALKKLDVSINYMYSKDNSGYAITFDPLYPANAGGSGSSVPAGAGILPATVYSISRLHLIGSYPIARYARLRADYVYDERKYSDYRWAGWSFSDGTVAGAPEKQRDQMVALSLYLML